MSTDDLCRHGNYRLKVQRGSAVCLDPPARGKRLFHRMCTVLLASALVLAFPKPGHTAEGWTYQMMNAEPANGISFWNPVINNAGQVAYVTRSTVAHLQERIAIRVTDGVNDVEAFAAISDSNPGVTNGQFLVGRIGLDDEGQVSFAGKLPGETGSNLYRVSNGQATRVSIDPDLFDQPIYS